MMMVNQVGRWRYFIQICHGKILLFIPWCMAFPLSSQGFYKSWIWEWKLLYIIWLRVNCITFVFMVFNPVTKGGFIVVWWFTWRLLGTDNRLKAWYSWKSGMTFILLLLLSSVSCFYYDWLAMSFWRASYKKTLFYFHHLPGYPVLKKKKKEKVQHTLIIFPI